MAIVPADIEWRADGTPASPAYGDIYHSAAGGLAQARHVFLGGNGLPGAWGRRARFVIVETGFGLGTNFLATWAAWRDDPARCERLFYVSLDLHPPRADDLRRMHGAGPLAALGAQLAGGWPVLAPGLHTLSFEAGRVTLLLGFGAVDALLGEFAVQADAIYLDGFAPAKNPEMWSPAVMRALARLARPGATTCATYSAAQRVREALAGQGFEVNAAPGFAAKREMTVGRYLGRPGRRAPGAPAPAPAAAPRRALVIGAGVAGCAAAHALAARGIEVELLERAPAIATETSSNRMGALQPMIARDDNRAARFTRAGFFDACVRLHALLPRDPQCADLGGLLHLAMDEAEEAGMAATVAAAGFPPDYVRMLDRAEAGALAGVPVSRGGWWFARAGWVIPPRYAAGLVEAQGARIRVRTGCAVAHVAAAGACWRAFAADGRVLAEVDAVVAACAHGAPELLGLGVELQRLRGQVSELPATSFAPPRVPVAGDGYVLPARDGISVVGATYEFEEAATTAPRVESHMENLERLARLLAGQRATVDPARLAGRVGWRAIAPDRLPLAGLAHDAAALAACQGGHMPALAELVRRPGLACVAGLASRGLAWAGISAALVVAQLCGDPLPLERSLVDAVDPARFALRRLRRAH